ncbi:elongation factor Tu, mitochondrial [Tanacetum coccineum]
MPSPRPVKCKYMTRNTRNGRKNEENADSYEGLRRNPYDSITLLSHPSQHYGVTWPISYAVTYFMPTTWKASSALYGIQGVIKASIARRILPEVQALVQKLGRGTVVATGRVEQGMIKVGEEIEIMGLMQGGHPRKCIMNSSILLRPLETWPGNASAEKPKGVFLSCIN